MLISKDQICGNTLILYYGIVSLFDGLVFLFYFSVSAHAITENQNEIFTYYIISLRWKHDPFLSKDVYVVLQIKYRL